MQTLSIDLLKPNSQDSLEAQAIRALIDQYFADPENENNVVLPGGDHTILLNGESVIVKINPDIHIIKTRRNKDNDHKDPYDAGDDYVYHVMTTKCLGSGLYGSVYESPIVIRKTNYSYSGKTIPTVVFRERKRALKIQSGDTCDDKLRAENEANNVHEIYRENSKKFATFGVNIPSFVKSSFWVTRSQDSYAYTVQPLFSKPTLKRYLEEHKNDLDDMKLLDLLILVLKKISEFHEKKGISHGDISFSNIRGCLQFTLVTMLNYTPLQP
jgi:tRNA A-37 threonylcarbamoyl transferase component Bud32